ncbi:MAG: PfkB family carbohydrate kinase, partial [Spirochaetales bacterium]|nr:PfkB family carbohydrate kinase [Spirochaetales bacterium]
MGLSPALGRVATLSHHLEPGAVNRSTAYLEVAAGKACNAARVICQMGYESTLVSPIGDESLAQYRRFVTEDGVRLRAVSYSGRVRWAITLLDPQHGATEVVVGEPHPVPKDTAEGLVSAVEEEMAGARACLLAGSRLADIPREVVTAVVRGAQSAGVPLFLDIRGGDLAAALAAAEHGKSTLTVKINEEEFTAFSGEDDTSHAHEVSVSTSPTFDLRGAIATFARRHRCN